MTSRGSLESVVGDLPVQVGAGDSNKWENTIKLVREVTGKPLYGTTQRQFFEATRSGVLLCAFANSLLPGTIHHVHRHVADENLAKLNAKLFIEVAESIGLDAADLFDPEHLYDGTQVDKVAHALYEMRRAWGELPTPRRMSSAPTVRSAPRSSTVAMPSTRQSHTSGHKRTSSMNESPAMEGLSLRLRLGPRGKLDKELRDLLVSTRTVLWISVDESKAPQIPPEEAARALGESLPVSLEELRLVGLHAAMAPAVERLLREGSIRGLEITGMDATEAEARTAIVTVARGLAAQREDMDAEALRILILTFDQIDDDGARRIGEAISGCMGLRVLYLEGNYIGDIGVKSLQPSLRSLLSLQELDLSSNRIGDDGAVAVADALWGSLELTVLHLDLNHIGDLGALRLAEGLRGCLKLEELGLGSNVIGDAGGRAIASSLAECPKLELVALAYNNITPEAAADVRKTLADKHDLAEDDS